MLTMENKSMGWRTESHKNRLEWFCFSIDGSSSYQTHLLIKIINSGQNIKTIWQHWRVNADRNCWKWYLSKVHFQKKKCISILKAFQLRVEHISKKGPGDIRS